MHQDEIRDLIRLVEESDIEELEISHWGKKIRIAKRITRESASTVALPAFAQPPAPPTDKREETEHAPEEDVDITDLLPVKSPMVGTFYAAPAPDADPFIKLGDNISSGTIVCIIEAMKLMNEIRSENDGRVVKILVENGEPVEFGQTLFLLTPS